MLYISVRNSPFSKSLAAPIRFKLTMKLFRSGFLCIVVLSVLYCPVQSGEHEELKKDKIKDIQDGGVYIQKGNIGGKHRKQNSVAMRIVLGSEAGKKSHPYLVGIRLNYNGLQFCAGTIISKSFILTAAHCLADSKTREVNPIDDRSVYLGVHDRHNHITEQKFTIVQTIVHENFLKKELDGFLHHDIGLIKINPQIVYNPFIRRICLAKNDTNVLDSSAIGTVQGWGRDYPVTGMVQQYVMKTTLSILSGDECFKLMPEQNPEHEMPDHDTVICGIDKQRTPNSGTCRGDSGGPFFLKTAGGPKVQIGIISYSKDCGIYHYPAVFTRVSHFLPWILSHVPQSTVCVIDA